MGRKLPGLVDGWGQRAVSFETPMRDAKHRARARPAPQGRARSAPTLRAGREGRRRSSTVRTEPREPLRIAFNPK